MEKRTFRYSLLAVLVGYLALGACAAADNANEKRGRGDAGVRAIDDTPKDVIQMPDRFSNVAHACDGHGHRIFVTTQTDSGRFLAVVNDPSCGGAS